MTMGHAHTAYIAKVCHAVSVGPSAPTAPQKYEEALGLCRQVIARLQFVADPYTLMAMVYEEMDQPDKVLRCKVPHQSHGTALAISPLCSPRVQIIESACLKSSEVDWYQMGLFAKAANEMDQAAEYFNKAVIRDSTNLVSYRSCRVYHLTPLLGGDVRVDNHSSESEPAPQKSTADRPHDQGRAAQHCTLS